jgi:hypothetical protein
MPNNPKDEDYNNLVISNASEDANNDFIISNANEPLSLTPNFWPTRASISSA